MSKITSTKRRNDDEIKLISRALACWKYNHDKNIMKVKAISLKVRENLAMRKRFLNHRSWRLRKRRNIHDILLVVQCIADTNVTITKNKWHGQRAKKKWRIFNMYTYITGESCETFLLYHCHSSDGLEGRHYCTVILWSVSFFCLSSAFHASWQVRAQVLR